jgi:ATP-dependent DNA ligase
MGSEHSALIEHRRTELISRNGHRFSSFADLEKLISAGLPDTRAVIDGEIYSLDKKGRPRFTDLLFHRGDYPCFLAFDLSCVTARIAAMKACWIANKSCGDS